ncbi:NtaA/DmoA family FMN-dependent monooxygenase [Ornithinicoccus hortensis]|uniref:FMN-dependent oxidoreductase (Nitrilotriacetate monooxygenase family) n=1 Tax=Ornithinicoccus hortensis TaxID=82346 RepID=A0A542YMH9_9MICO|nr:NtaA/DmoA family FMN-dependent monooxygenase [Ornithinicoccus hortensis]TQL49296.1 FMN-dependent oxidoreductase (nitrilotriacetate monooxygenase family) [Ornithinicoccus hortensis]
MSTPPKQVILGAHFPGVNNTTVWSDPRSGSHIEFDSFRRFARAAERGHLDFLFLAEGLRLREQRGLIHDLDVVGRPDTLPVLAALAGVTDHLGLVGTINATFNEPYEVARQFATLDHLSGGRAGWNVVTSSDAFTGENFRRGGYLDRELRYERAESIVRAARHLWDSWQVDAVAGDQEHGRFLADGTVGEFGYHDDHFDIAGHFNVPRSPQQHPVIFQAGDSDGGREFAARTADVIFTRHGTPEAGRAFFRDVKSRLARYGRRPDDLKILPGVTFVVGDTDEEAAELAADIRRQQVSGQTAILLLEQVWNRDLSGYDPDGPLPDVEPEVGPSSIIQGRARHVDDARAEVTRLRALAEEKNLTLREVAIERGQRQAFVGSPETIADALIDAVQTEVSDGFILVPHITPGGLDAFVDQVVPLLVERGALRASYAEGSTLRDQLGLSAARPATDWETAAAAGVRKESA